MKNVLLILSVLFIFFNSNAQDEITIKLKDTKGQVLKNVEVIANNKDASVIVKGTTDVRGSVTLTLTEAGVYSLSFLDNKDFDTYEVKEGFRGSFSRTVTYDPKGVFAAKPKADRSGIQFTTISSTQFKGKPGTMKLTIRLLTTKKVPVPGTKVTVVSISGKFKMDGRTNASGDAVYNVPINSSYEVDVDDNESLKTVETPNAAGSNITHFVFYEKLRINEIAKGDTIVQKNITQTNGTNTHLLFTVKLNNYEGLPLKGEPIYLQAENGSRVYEGITDGSGECTLMLQKNANYILNVKYEQGLHLVEAKNMTGFGRESLTRRYRGSEEIERIIAEQEAEMKRIREMEAAQKKRLEEMALAEKERRELQKKMEKELVQKFYDDKLVPSFRSTPVRGATPPTDYITPNSKGFSLQFKSSGPIGTPTIVDDNMFIPAGFYSTSFYCLEAATGNYQWGVELGESGASPAVHSNGVILINTYSCTLYAIDAKTGKLLWSKWLAGTVYSSPTADGDKVYVVFHYGGAYVLSCFDLRTGNFKWINRVDSETIACPVIEGDEVHVASQSGFYYIFNKETGKPIEVLTSIDAVSSPTITDKSIFLTANVEGKDRLVEIDRTTHEIKKEFKGDLNPIQARSAGNCQKQMNFNGSHPIVYKNKYVVLLDRSGLKVFDMQSEKVLWEKPVSVANCQVPIVVDNKIYLGTNDGEVKVYDIATGTSKSVEKHSSPIDAQPVYHKGILYVVSAGVLTAIKSIQNFQWSQWNKDATHNLRID